MAACQGSTCRSGRRPCLSPEKCGMFNAPSLLSPQERSAFDWLDRWGFPIAVAAVVAIVIALLIVLNWPHLSRWLGA